MSLKNVRISNLLKAGNSVVIVNEVLLKKLKENDYKYGIIEAQPIDKFMKGRILKDNPQITEEYLSNFKHVHDLQNDYSDNYQEHIYFTISR